MDVWGAGCLLAELASGRHPFGEELRAIGEPGTAASYSWMVAMARKLGTPPQDAFPGPWPQWAPRDLAEAYPTLCADGAALLGDLLAWAPGRRPTGG